MSNISYMNNKQIFAETINMNKILLFLSFILSLLLPFNSFCVASNLKSSAKAIDKPIMVIVIDDFGSYDQSGVETMLSIDAPLTCAVMPFLENTQINTQMAIKSGKEVIVHMPMQACVNLPLSWYGKLYIGNHDNKEQIYSKLQSAFENIPEAKGFNIHIGSGVCQYVNTVEEIYNYSIEHDLFFLDSRTHLNTICDKVAKNKNVVYLGRDEFLEPNGNKSYNGVKNHLIIGANIAKEKGYSIVIGHVGSHGGEQTAQAIKDSINTIKSMGVEIVPLSYLYKQFQK